MNSTRLKPSRDLGVRLKMLDGDGMHVRCQPSLGSPMASELLVYRYPISIPCAPTLIRVRTDAKQSRRSRHKEEDI